MDVNQAGGDPFWRMLHGAVDADPLLAVLPGASAAPDEICQWWESLDPSTRAEATKRYGTYLGRIDGIPIAVRDRYNTERLDADLGVIAAELESLTSRRLRTRNQRARVRHWTHLLSGLVATRERLTRPRSGEPNAYLIDYDTVGTGHLVVALGDPETAHRVATYVPGAATSVASAPGALTTSSNLLTAVALLDTDTEHEIDTAVVIWIYPTPPLDLSNSSTARVRHSQPGHRRGRCPPPGPIPARLGGEEPTRTRHRPVEVAAVSHAHRAQLRMPGGQGRRFDLRGGCVGDLVERRGRHPSRPSRAARGAQGLRHARSAGARQARPR